MTSLSWASVDQDPRSSFVFFAEFDHLFCDRKSNFWTNSVYIAVIKRWKNIIITCTTAYYRSVAFLIWVFADLKVRTTSHSMIQLNKGILIPATVKEMRLHASPEKSLLGEWGRARERRNLRSPLNMIVPVDDYSFRGQHLELVRQCLSCKRGPSVMANK